MASIQILSVTIRNWPVGMASMSGQVKEGVMFVHSVFCQSQGRGVAHVPLVPGKEV